MNLKILAYKTESGIWAFDHEHQNTVAEALCNGTEHVIDWYFEMLNERQPVTDDKIYFLLDTNQFEGAITEIQLIETDQYGSVYRDKASGMNLWLCPWLQGYFGKVPEMIYIYCEKYQEPEVDEEFERLLNLSLLD